MNATLTRLARDTKNVIRPVLNGQSVHVTEHGKQIARIIPAPPRRVMSAAEFRALNIPDDELDQAILAAIKESQGQE